MSLRNGKHISFDSQNNSKRNDKMILVVDDDKNIRLSLKLILERNEYEVTPTNASNYRQNR